MGVVRRELSFEGQFVQVPNAWARDGRVSRKARGLLVEIMSHRVGWHITTRSLAESGTEGRDAVMSALRELVDAGYLRRVQGRSGGGSFSEIEYELVDPDPTVVGFSDHGDDSEEIPGQDRGGVSRGRVSRGRVIRTKEHYPSEEHLEGLAQPPVERDLGALFDAFWGVYPRRVGKAGARRAFEVVARSTDPQVIVDGARRLAADPNLPEVRFVPHPSTWLRRGSWEDEPYPADGSGERVTVPEAFAPGDEWMEFNR